MWCHRELARKGAEITAERKNSVIEVCDLISANEVKNQKTERIAIKVCSCWILKSHVGDDFEATVSGIEEWGIYVSIADPIAEGLVRFRDIAGDDFYVFNPDQGLAFGKKSGRTFRRGDKVLVRLLRVDPLRGQADFSIIEKLSSEPKKRRRQGEDNDYRNRDVRERADRAAAAEALGYVSQPDEDFDDDVPEFVSAHSHMNRGGRGKSRSGRFDSDAPSFERRGSRRGGRNDRGDDREGFHVASKPRKGGSRKGAGRSNRSHGRGGRR